MTGETVAARRDLLARVLDTLVPPVDGFPGGAAAALDHILSRAADSAELAQLLADGLGAVEEASRTRAAGGLEALGPDDRECVLRCVERSHPEFFVVLVRHAYDGYYSHPTVLARLGLDPSPPHPRGHKVEPVDPPDLARVRARGPLYRRA